MAIILNALLLGLYSFSSCIARSLRPQLPLSSSDIPSPDIPYTFRQATYADINEITDVIVDAFDPSDEWKYNYQFKDDYPIYHRECMRQFILSRWNEFEHQNSTIMNVIEVPITDSSTFGDSSSSSTSPSSPLRTSRVVAIGLWQIRAEEDDKTQPYSLPPFFNLPFLSTVDIDIDINADADADTDNEASSSSSSSFSPFSSTSLSSSPSSPSQPVITWPNCSQHLDANKTRATDFAAKFAVAMHEYIDIAYPEGQLYLALLATHPDYDGHNFGATHCRWGMELAARRARDEPVTLMATPAGYPLYRALGFEEVKNVTLEFLDGLGGSWTQVMRWR